MKIYYFIICSIFILGCNENKTKSKKDEITQEKVGFINTNPYQEDENCSIFAVSKYSIIKERFRVYSDVLEDEFFNRIDTICSLGIKHPNEDKNVYIEYWKFKNSDIAKEYQAKLDNLPEGIKYKPPTNWLWKSYKNGILFYYSLEASTSDSLFQEVFKNYQKNNKENCCEQWLKLQ